MGGAGGGPSPFPPLTRLANAQLPITLILAPVLVFPVPVVTWIALIALIAVAVARKLAGLPWLRPTPMNGPALAIAAFACLGLAVAPDPARSVERLTNVLIQVAIFVAAVNHGWTARTARWAIGGLTGVGIASALIGLIGGRWESGALIVPVPAIYDRLPRVVIDLPSAISEPNELLYPRLIGGTLAILIPVAVVGGLFGGRGWLRAAGWIGAGVMAIVLLLSQTISGIAGVALVVAGLLALSRAGRIWLIAGGGLAAIAAIGGAIAFNGLAGLFAATGRIGEPFLARIELWRWSIYALADVPFTGIGLNALHYSFGAFYPEFPLPPEGVPHAHQLILHTALDLGIGGAIALVLLAAGAGVAIRRTRWRALEADRRALGIGAVGAAIAFLVFSLVDLIPIGGKPLIALWLLIGCLGALSAEAGVPGWWPVRFSRRSAIGLAGAVAIGGAVTAPVWLPAIRLNLGTAVAHRDLFDRMQGRPVAAGRAEAARDWLRVAAAAGAGPHPVRLIGSLDGWLGEDAAAVARFREFVARGGDRAGADRVFGGVGAAPTDPRVAIDRVARGIRRQPGRWDLYLQVALMQAANGQAENARATLRDGIAAGALPGPLNAALEGGR